MLMSQITIEMLVEAYGESCDGIRIFDKKGRGVGYVTDLKMKFAKDKAAQKKQKEYRDRKSEERREALEGDAPLMVEFLQNHLANLDAEIFVNQTQPNVKVNGHTCYVVVEPLTQQHRLGIKHKFMSQDEMAEEVGTQFRISASDNKNHILLNGLSQDDIVETIKKLCSK